MKSSRISRTRTRKHLQPLLRKRNPELSQIHQSQLHQLLKKAKARKQKLNQPRDRGNQILRSKRQRNLRLQSKLIDQSILVLSTTRGLIQRLSPWKLKPYIPLQLFQLRWTRLDPQRLLTLRERFSGPPTIRGVVQIRKYQQRSYPCCIEKKGSKCSPFFYHC